MKTTLERLKPFLYEAVQHLSSVSLVKLDIRPTRKEFSGHITLVLFPLLKIFKKPLEHIGREIGSYVKEHAPMVRSFHLVKGFLNFECTDDYYFRLLQDLCEDDFFFQKSSLKGTLMIEYSSPNTNKPLHLGHIRNHLLGHSIAELFKSMGRKVIKTQIINDRGIHICKSMLAWKKFSGGETPESSNLKGDHLVGKYYVAFEKAYRKEIADLCAQGYKRVRAEEKAPMMQEVHKLLRLWERGDAETIALWRRMNSWVYQGFEQTYQRLGIDFDDTQYESNTYLLGKRIIEEGLKKKVFFHKEDGSVWVDLTAEGFDEKLLLRKDGTSVYITQDLGTAVERFEKYPIEALIYTVGEEQEYHFQVLFLILKRMGYPWADRLFHLSYGMVELPSGKMKSREGTVVDADDLMIQMHQVAKSFTQDLGKLKDSAPEEKESLYETIGLGALKYHILKVDPKKRILFDPKASVDFKGNTGPYIQYTYARIRSLESKACGNAYENLSVCLLGEYEKSLLKILEQYPDSINFSAKNLNPSLVVNYVYELAKSFNDFYQNVNILKAHDPSKAAFCLKLALTCGKVLKIAMKFLGINMPDNM
ncbi:arginine--tRNA ligase [Bacteroidetes bacterium endosymbiont of Geopemphigus sp.]|uniref:arginine--tRNA ligase n=1 Tax=Bacteroidetes bacterium endosymbiont of Geopemphigus sp. TaxID=2047937 RepID=UPI000CD2001A|nr:arginine--tRNA ligase [Bacteroidetes bacterium endosymbiont of Geopemphigus sp.]